MPDRYVVPQFIDVEDKIVGPITARQFVISLVIILILFIMFKLLSFRIFLITGLPVLGFGAVLAFVKVNGMPFHYFLINMIQTLRRPNLRVWDKKMTDTELKNIIKPKAEPLSPEFIPKKPPTESHLNELSLVVNTGGVFRPEENE